MARKTQSPEARIKELDLELQFAKRADWAGDFHFWMKRGGSIIVVGYLASDCDCDDPLKSCDAMGKIITKHQDGQFKRHVGCDENNTPDLDEFFNHIARLRGVNVDEMVGANDENVIQSAFSMWKEAWKRGKIGTPWAQPLQENYNSGYRHLEISTSITSETIKAVWVPDKALMEHITSFPEGGRYVEAEKCFYQALDEYNKWAEGDCYGVCIDVFRRVSKNEYEIDLETSDACWGYIGNEHASEMLDDEMDATKAFMKKEILCISMPHSPSSAHSPTA